MLGCGAATRAFAARIAVRLMLFWTLPVSALPLAATPATQGIQPRGPILVRVGKSSEAGEIEKVISFQPKLEILYRRRGAWSKLGVITNTGATQYNIL
jgi:hypothetical protein